MDFINIYDLHFYGYHGLFAEEKQNGQNFYLSLRLGCDTAPAADSGDLSLSVDYGAVCHRVTEFLTKNRYDLIETAAEETARYLLHTYPIIREVTLELKKPEAPIGLPLKTASVTITRKRHTAYIGLGSNLGDREAYLNTALDRLRSHPEIEVENVSDFIVTAPVGPQDQPDFLNCCAKLTTLLSAPQLLSFLQELELEAKRERIIHWGPRTLDLDILLFDDEVTVNEHLILPHPQMHLRHFVLEPLNQIAPYAIHPLYRKRVMDLYTELLERKDS
ncbi:MAG: 2-amino-4-hydroxy-6-hydroxymethyldihydropteridine diphosphokinase [Lachnospiraceae bacterium]|nr:2-amino-4-hydroxy-6-hydroxymethyldihydropteridine diphosphokinase [Lachnospiraceae bacterium]